MEVSYNTSESHLTLMLTMMLTQMLSAKPWLHTSDMLNKNEHGKTFANQATFYWSRSKIYYLKLLQREIQLNQRSVVVARITSPTSNRHTQMSSSHSQNLCFTLRKMCTYDCEIKQGSRTNDKAERKKGPDPSSLPVIGQLSLSEPFS